MQGALKARNLALVTRMIRASVRQGTAPEQPETGRLVWLRPLAQLPKGPMRMRDNDDGPLAA